MSLIASLRTIASKVNSATSLATATASGVRIVSRMDDVIESLATTKTPLVSPTLRLSSRRRTVRTRHCRRVGLLDLLVSGRYTFGSMPRLVCQKARISKVFAVVR